MGAFKASKPRANPPVCWLCDGTLYGGGRFYELVVCDDGLEHPAHGSCAKEAARPVKHHAVDSVPESTAAHSMLPEARPLRRGR